MNTLHLATPEDLEKLLPLVTGFHAEMGFETTPEHQHEAIAPLLEGSPHGAIWLIGPRRAPVGLWVAAGALGTAALFGIGLLCRRVAPALNLEAQAGSATIIAHAGTIRAALALALDNRPAALAFDIAPLSLTRLAWLPDGMFFVRCVNEQV